MRSFVISTFALAAVVALAPSAAFAQPPAQQQQPPAGQPPAGQQPAAPAAPKLTFTTPAGMLLVQVKPGNSTCDQPAAAQPPAASSSTGQPPAGQAAAAPCTPQPYTQIFEEMVGKLKAAFSSPSSPPEVKAQASSWRIYKSSEPGPNGNVFYVMLIDPTVPNNEYQFFELIQKSLTPEQQRDPATAQMYQRFNSAIAQMSKLDLTPVSGGQ